MSAEPLLATNPLPPSLCQQGTGTSWSATRCGGDCFSITDSATATLQPRGSLSGRLQPSTSDHGLSLDELVPLCLSCVTCASGRTRSFRCLMTRGAKHSGGARTFPCPVTAQLQCMLWHLGGFNQCDLGQELSALANQKALEMDGCDFDDAIFLTVRCSAEPPSHLPVQLRGGDQTLSPSVGGGTTARNRAARQAATCRRGPKLLSATTHF